MGEYDAHGGPKGAPLSSYKGTGSGAYYEASGGGLSSGYGTGKESHGAASWYDQYGKAGSKEAAGQYGKESAWYAETAYGGQKGAWVAEKGLGYTPPPPPPGAWAGDKGAYAAGPGAKGTYPGAGAGAPGVPAGFTGNWASAILTNPTDSQPFDPLTAVSALLAADRSVS